MIFLFYEVIILTKQKTKGDHFMSDKNQENSYDKVPYVSYPFPQSSPEKLATLATLFGMETPKIENAKVLELGCAEGGNLIPHALQNPKGKYVGVDLSKGQIESGQKHVDALKIKNIELKHCSIMDIDESFGKFDYIICHGVFSWVTAEVQNKILEISKKNLTENGVAYISYNTLPGWNMVRTIRDMMMYHSRGFEKEEEKIQQSRALLSFVKESLDGVETPYAKFLTQEANLLENQGDHYLRHDHLEDNNTQLYFTDFAIMAAQHGMQYLSDVSLATMYLGNMKPSVVEKMKDLKDIIRTEQYMDFINNRRFRSTLLCHSNVKLDRALNNNSILKFAMTLNVAPENPVEKASIESDQEEKFYYSNNKENYIGAKSPALKAILFTFAANRGYPLKFDTVIEKANKLFKKDNKDQIKAELLANAMNLVMKGFMEIHMNEKTRDKINLTKPSARKLPSYQASNTQHSWVTNHSHTPVSITIVDKFALQYMDGKSSKPEIIDQLMKNVAAGDIKVSQGEKAVDDKEMIKKELGAYLDQAIERLVVQGVLA